MTDPNEEISPSEFFNKTRSIALIARMNRSNGNIKTELESELDVSGNTLKSLLDDAVRADLIRRTPIQSGDHPRATRYQLTKRGEYAQSLLRMMGLDEVHREYMARKKTLEDAIPDVQTLIQEEGLNEEYLDKDYWSQSNSDVDELHVGNDSIESEFSKEIETGIELPDIEGRNPIDPDIRDGDSPDDENEDRGRVETWGEVDADADDE